MISQSMVARCISEFGLEINERILSGQLFSAWKSADTQDAIESPKKLVHGNRGGRSRPPRLSKTRPLRNTRPIKLLAASVSYRIGAGCACHCRPGAIQLIRAFQRNASGPTNDN